MAPRTKRRAGANLTTAAAEILGIPTVIDRMVQQAIHQQLGILCDPISARAVLASVPTDRHTMRFNKRRNMSERGKEWAVMIGFSFL
ncbi:MAG: hypothetical protein IPN95_28965 [Bacteroidetes bacterium]|nr:hypothetical protein [Bacteroidota bacterium]